MKWAWGRLTGFTLDLLWSKGQRLRTAELNAMTFYGTLTQSGHKDWTGKQALSCLHLFYLYASGLALTWLRFLSILCSASDAVRFLIVLHYWFPQQHSSYLFGSKEQAVQCLLCPGFQSGSVPTTSIIFAPLHYPVSIFSIFSNKNYCVNQVMLKIVN